MVYIISKEYTAPSTHKVEDYLAQLGYAYIWEPISLPLIGGQAKQKSHMPVGIGDMLPYLAYTNNIPLPPPHPAHAHTHMYIYINMCVCVYLRSR